MNDIHDIEGIKSIDMLADNFIIFVLFFLISLYLFYALSKYYKSKSRSIITHVLKRKPFINKIKSIDVDNDNFFEDVSFIVRYYISKKWAAPWAENKSIAQIKSIIEEKQKDLIIFLEDCDKYQHSKLIADKEKKIEIKNLAIDIIRKI